MKAIIRTQEQNARQPDNKELVSTYDVVGTIDGKLCSIVTARCYMGRSSSASVVYACLWVHGKDVYTSGRGQAGGWGYHKESAAIDSAIRSAGIELYGSPYGSERDKADAKKQTSISGVGSSAIDDALMAIAKAAGARGHLLIVRN